MKKPQTKIEKLSPEQLKAIAPLHAAAAVVAPKAEKAVLNDEKNRKKLTTEQTEEELKALEQAEAEQVAEVAGEPIELAQAAEAAATDAAAGGAVAAETTSGLVGGAVAGGVGTGAVAGGALVGAAALNNGGDDAQPRMLTQFSNENKDKAFNQENVIAEVVNIEATSIDVQTVAAGVTSVSSNTLTSEGVQTQTVSEAVAAETVDMTATGNVEPMPMDDVSAFGWWPSEGISVGTGKRIIDDARVGSGDIDFSGIHAKEVTLTAEDQVVEFSQITGGSRLVETTIEPSNETGVYSQEFDLSVNAANSVNITAGQVRGESQFIQFGNLNFLAPNVVAKEFSVEANSISSLNVGGAYSVNVARSEDNDASDFATGSSSETLTTEAADEVNITASYIDNAQILADSVVVLDGSVEGEDGGLYIESMTIAGSVEVSFSNSGSFGENNGISSSEEKGENVFQVQGAKEVEIDADYIEQLQILADSVNVTANRIDNISVTGSTESSSSSSSSGTNAYDEDFEEFFNVSRVETETGTFSVTAASEVTVAVNGETEEKSGAEIEDNIVSLDWNFSSTGINLAAEVVNVTTDGSLFGTSNQFGLPLMGDFDNPYSISGAYSFTQSSEWVSGEEMPSSSSSSAQTTFEAAESVTLTAMGSIGELAVAAENFTATASYFGGLSVDGGRTSSFDFSEDNIVQFGIKGEDNENVAAADMVTITANGDHDSSINVKALAGSITTKGSEESWGDSVTVLNAEGQAQEITIDLGFGEMDRVNFAGVSFEDASYEVDVDTDTVTFTFVDGEVEDVYTLTDVEEFVFNGASYALIENELIQNNLAAAVG